MRRNIPAIEELRSLPIGRKSGWPWTVESVGSAIATHDDRPWPKISIVTPSYNQGAFIEKTIRSVLLQGYPNLEYIIIDGGSTDDTIEIIKKYESWLTSWVSETDRGQSHAINKGLNLATGDLCGWLNSDDYYTEGALFKLANAYLDDTSVGAVYGQGHVIDTNGRVIYKPELRQVTHEGLFDWFSGHDFMQPSCLFTRDAWLECGPLDESIHISLDVDLWIRISEKFEFKKIDDLLSIALSHPQAKTTAMENLMYVDFAIMVMRHGNEAKARELLERQANILSELQAKMDKYNLKKKLKKLYRKIVK